MALIKIFTEGDESIGEVEESLVKAIQAKQDAQLLETRFDDNLMNRLSQDLDEDFKDIYTQLVTKIVDTLKNDY